VKRGAGRASKLLMAHMRIEQHDRYTFGHGSSMLDYLRMDTMGHGGGWGIGTCSSARAAQNSTGQRRQSSLAGRAAGGWRQGHEDEANGWMRRKQARPTV
jgi:hypothetical protein